MRPGQALILLDALIFWLVWVRMLPRETKSPFADPEPALAPVKTGYGKPQGPSRKRNKKPR